MFDKSDTGKWIREEAVVDSGAVECVTSKKRMPHLRVEAVAMRADIRQGDSSPSTDWRNDPPHEAPTSSLDFLHNTQTSNFLSRHFLTSFAYLLEGPF